MEIKTWKLSIKENPKTIKIRKNKLKKKIN